MLTKTTTDRNTHKDSNLTPYERLFSYTEAGSWNKIHHHKGPNRNGSEKAVKKPPSSTSGYAGAVGAIPQPQSQLARASAGVTNEVADHELGSGGDESQRCERLVLEVRWSGDTGGLLRLCEWGGAVSVSPFLLLKMTGASD